MKRIWIKLNISKIMEVWVKIWNIKSNFPMYRLICKLKGQFSREITGSDAYLRTNNFLHHIVSTTPPYKEFHFFSMNFTTLCLIDVDIGFPKFSPKFIHESKTCVTLESKTFVWHYIRGYTVQPHDLIDLQFNQFL